MPDTWTAEGEPLTQHVAAPNQPLPDRVATPAPVVTHVNSASQSQPHLSLTTMTFTEDNRTYHQAEKPIISPSEMTLRNGHSVLPCENSGRTGTLPG